MVSADGSKAIRILFGALISPGVTPPPPLALYLNVGKKPIASALSFVVCIRSYTHKEALAYACICSLEISYVKGSGGPKGVQAALDRLRGLQDESTLP